MKPATIKTPAGLDPARYQQYCDENGMFWFRNHEPALGENDALIMGINETGDIVAVDIDGHSDAVKLEYFSKLVIDDIEMAIQQEICNREGREWLP